MRLFNPFNDGDDALSIATIAAKLLSLSEQKGESIKGATALISVAAIDSECYCQG